MSNCACSDNCCNDKMPDMRFGERKPRHVDVKPFMDANYSNAISTVEWHVTPITPETASHLVVSNQKIDNSDFFVSANFSGGDAGVKYRIDLIIETCEGHIGRYCFTQYIKDC